MIRRVVAEVVLIVGIAVLLAWMVLAGFALTDSSDPLGTVLDQTPRVLFGLLGVALIVWAALVTIGAIVNRRRRAGWRVATHLVSLLAALIVNVVLLTVIAAASGGGQGGGWGMLVVAIAVGASLVLLIAGVAAVTLVEFVVLRPRRVTPPESSASIEPS